MSGQSGQWCPKSVQSGQWWPKSARSGQYLSLGIVGLANACFGHGRSGQYLSWVADFILGIIVYATTIQRNGRKTDSNPIGEERRMLLTIQNLYKNIVSTFAKFLSSK